jgi:prepilin-type N-terminal cleavage/methylation domain-containing protein
MNKILKQAFTLIELLVVIAIIGILSGLIVVSMSGVTQKANIAKAQVFSNSLRNSLMLNLISEWKLDENTGGVTADSWSGGNTGTLVGATHLPVWKEGSNCISGSCLQFDGTEDYVDFGADSNLSMGTGDATVSLWVEFDNALAPGNETLISCGGDTLDHKGYWLRRYSGTSYLHAFFSSGTIRISITLSAPGSLVANTWYNIVVVFDRDNVAQAYINGSKQTGYSGNITSQAADIQNYKSLTIGSWSTATGSRLAGKMDEVRLYNTAIPTSQIKEQYYVGLNNLLSNNVIEKEEYLNRINK